MENHAILRLKRRFRDAVCPYGSCKKGRGPGMKMFRFRAALLLALLLSVSQALPAFAKHKVLDSDTYTIEEVDDQVVCMDLEGEPVTGWVEDEDENLYYFDHGVMNHGWDKIRGEWYYFDPETGVLATSTTVLNYEVDEDGRMIKIREW